MGASRARVDLVRVLQQLHQQLHYVRETSGGEKRGHFAKAWESAKSVAHLIASRGEEIGPRQLRGTLTTDSNEMLARLERYRSSVDGDARHELLLSALRTLERLALHLGEEVRVPTDVFKRKSVVVETMTEPPPEAFYELLRRLVLDESRPSSSTGATDRRESDLQIPLVDDPPHRLRGLLREPLLEDVSRIVQLRFMREPPPKSEPYRMSAGIALAAGIVSGLTRNHTSVTARVLLGSSTPPDNRVDLGSSSIVKCQHNAALVIRSVAESIDLNLLQASKWPLSDCLLFLAAAHAQTRGVNPQVVRDHYGLGRFRAERDGAIALRDPSVPGRPSDACLTRLYFALVVKDGRPDGARPPQIAA